jgi:hypothetical protein
MTVPCLILSAADIDHKKGEQYPARLLKGSGESFFLHIYKAI